MGMLLLAHAAIPDEFEVAAVDHGLRAEAAQECALVERACAERGIGCATLRVETGGGNLQASARDARYAALARWAGDRGLGAVATAHHADDQAETLLMRLNRGSGVAGLAGVRESLLLAGTAIRLIRPLLAFRRHELAMVSEAVDFAADPSNADPRFDRVRIRRQLVACDWLEPVALARSAANLAEAYEALEAYADLLWQQSVRQDSDSWRLAPGPSREMNRRLLARIMEQLGGRPRGGDVARLLGRLEAGEGGNLAGVLATIVDGEWVLRPEPPRNLSSSPRT